MGYNTRYALGTKLFVAGELDLLSTKQHLAVVKELRAFSDEADYALDEYGQSGGEESRWYENETDLKEFSKKFPYILFILEGEGEQNGDMWRKYFVNGKMQVAKARIAIADFEPKELR